MKRTILLLSVAILCVLLCLGLVSCGGSDNKEGVYLIEYVGATGTKSLYTAEDEFELEAGYKLGYEFLGWYEDEALTKPITKIEKGTTGNLKLYAKMEYQPFEFLLVGDSEYALVGFNDKNATNIVVPGKYNGLPVTTIERHAIISENLRTIVIDENVVMIKKHAISSPMLEMIVLPDSLEQTVNPEIARSSDKLTVYAKGAFSCAHYSAFELYKIIKDYGVTSDGIVWVVDEEDQLKIVGCQEQKENLILPNEINGKVVTKIGENAFYCCNKIKSITLPQKVNKIENNAFYNCINLTFVRVGDELEAINKSSFDMCNKLENIEVDKNNPVLSSRDGNVYSKDEKTIVLYPKGKKDTTFVIPSYVTSIGKNAFRDCTSLTSIEIPNSVTEIGSSAFSGCTGLTSVTIGNGVTTIGEYAFRDCTSLTSIKIPNSVTTIGNYAFSGCSNLTIYCEAESKPNGWGSNWNKLNSDGSCPVVWNVKEQGATEDGIIWATTNNKPNDIIITGVTKETRFLTIPEKINNLPVTTIHDMAFQACTSLEIVNIPNCVTSIGNNAFKGCTGLTSIEIPNSVTKIGSYVFEGCTGLTSIEIPNSLTSTGWGTFVGCTGLTSIEIPNSVTRIDNGAFSGCTGLTSVTIGNGVTTIGEYAFRDCTSLTSIEIPNSVTTIGGNAFEGCTSLESITIPNSVTTIRDYAFYGCSNLTIYCEAESQPSRWDWYWNDSRCPVVWGHKEN